MLAQRRLLEETEGTYFQVKIWVPKKFGKHHCTPNLLGNEMKGSVLPNIKWLQKYNTKK